MSESKHTPHPIQPVLPDRHGVLRFKQNRIVDFLAREKMNDLATMDFPREDWVQLAQLIGYSLNGFGTLSYVTNEDYDAADHLRKSNAATQNDARILALTEEMERLRGLLRQINEISEDIGA